MGVRPPTPHALASTPDHHTRSAPSPEARGAPARRVDAPLRCGVPQGPHHLVRWCGGVVRRGVSVGAEQARARTPFASPAGDSAIRRPRRSGCARLCALRARTARIRLRDGRGCWWRVSTQSASPHRSPVGRGRGRGCRITRLGRHTERVLSSCTLGRGVLAEGGMSGRIPHGRWRAGGGLGAVLGARRGVGGDSPGAVAVSLAREDHTTTKEQSLVGFGTLGKLRASAIFFFAKRVCRVVTNLSFLCARTY